MPNEIPTPTEQDIQRFWSHVEKTETCWLWKDKVFGWGYGRFCFAKGYVLAHRYSWVIHYGPIPTGLWVLHNCDVGACIRPDHLFLGNATQNAADRHAKSRDSKGEDRWNAVLTCDDVKRILAMRGVISQRKLGEAYGINQSHVSAIQRGKVWKHVLIDDGRVDQPPGHVG